MVSLKINSTLGTTGLGDVLEGASRGRSLQELKAALALQALVTILDEH